MLRVALVLDRRFHRQTSLPCLPPAVPQSIHVHSHSQSNHRILRAYLPRSAILCPAADPGTIPFARLVLATITTALHNALVWPFDGKWVQVRVSLLVSATTPLFLNRCHCHHHPRLLLTHPPVLRFSLAPPSSSITTTRPFLSLHPI